MDKMEQERPESATLERVFLFHEKWIDVLDLSGGAERSVRAQARKNRRAHG